MTLSNSFKVLITTSGVGSRLGEITDFTNKSLVIVGDKPAISYIIENYSPDTEFVITLGYFGNHVREYLELAYPERSFEFINVEKFTGYGSSLAFSMLQAKSVLKCKFIYHACDTLIPGEKLQLLETNWVGGYKSEDATNYARFDVSGNQVKRFHRKGMTEFDFLHIGIVGIVDYKEFWNQLESLVEINSDDSTLNDVSVVERMQSKGIIFHSREFKNWVDIGNSNALTTARKALGKNQNILPKTQESVSFLQKSVIKFFSDPSIVANRVQRAKYLNDCVPEIEGESTHFYRYKYIEGKLASSLNNPNVINDLLEWASNKLWISPNEIEIKHLEEACRTFYIDKTNSRLDDFFKTRGIVDENSIINGIKVPTINKLLNMAEKILLESPKIKGYHGDFILDNIIVTEEGFKLIDWRQDFAGRFDFGDMYYDIAKLNHSLHITHEIVNQNLYFITNENGSIECGIKRKDVHVKMEKLLDKFAQTQNLDTYKIKVMTAIIWLNMAPLHHHPFDTFLFYYGKINLWNSLNEI